MTTTTRTLFRTGAITLPLLAVGCGPVLQNPTPQPVVEAQQATFQATDYHIKPGDALEVKHRLATELNEVAVVRPDGRISLPLLPSVKAAGLTSDELTTTLKTAYARDLRDVELSVLVRGFATQRIFVGGEVEKPGMIDLVDGETVMQAVYAAGGMKTTARPDEIVVLRRTNVPNQRLAFAVNLKQVVSGENVGQDTQLQPLDTVIVPRSDIAQLNLWVEQYIKNMIPTNTSVIYSFQDTAAPGSSAVIR